MIRLNDLSVIHFNGKDAGGFLHNQLTADINSLQPSECTFAALCQPKGRVIALLLVQRTEVGYRVLCSAELAEGLIDYLLRFRFREKVDISLQEDLAVSLLADPAEAEDGQALISPLEALHYLVQPDNIAADSDPARAEDARARQLARGVVWLDKHTSEQFLPQMLGQEAIGALNFRKGCFPGQEIIARTRYLGKLKRHPWTGRLEEALDVTAMGALTLWGGGNEAGGVLVSQANFADGGCQAFVVARRGDAFNVKSLVTEGGAFEAVGEWLSPPAKEEE